MTKPKERIATSPADPPTLTASPALIVANIGAPGDDDVVYSRLLVDHVSQDFLEDCHEPFSARCIVFASLLDDQSAIRQQQLQILDQLERSATRDETIRLAKVLSTIPVRFRLPIFEIIQGTLTAFSQQQFLKFQETLKALIVADKTIDLFEFFLLHHLLVHLRRHLGLGIKNEVKYEQLNAVTKEVELVLSVVARYGHDTKEAAEQSFAGVSASLPRLARSISFTGGDWNFSTLNEAIKELSHLSFSAKKELLTALAELIIHDKTITHTEAELFRAIAESLDCPVPPIIADVPKNS